MWVEFFRGEQKILTCIDSKHTVGMYGRVGYLWPTNKTCRDTNTTPQRSIDQSFSKLSQIHNLFCFKSTHKNTMPSHNVICQGCGKICCSNCDASGVLVLAYCKCFGGAATGFANTMSKVGSFGLAPDIQKRCNSCGCHKDKHSFKKKGVFGESGV